MLFVCPSSLCSVYLVNQPNGKILVAFSADSYQTLSLKYMKKVLTQRALKFYSEIFYQVYLTRKLKIQNWISFQNSPPMTFDFSPFIMSICKNLVSTLGEFCKKKSKTKILPLITLGFSPIFQVKLVKYKNYREVVLCLEIICSLFQWPLLRYKYTIVLLVIYT